MAAATRRQVAAAIGAGLPAWRIDPLKAEPPAEQARGALAWLAEQDRARPALVYSTAEPDAIAAAKHALGRDQAGPLIEHALADVAAGAVAAGFTRLLVAGGETSGAVVGRLGVDALEIGPEIAPGVPWTRSAGAPALALALKSGNFGADDIFISAWELLE
jgi:uncharacterized protein YgbK (DUF1537 family)